MEDDYAHMRRLLALAEDTAPDQLITVDGRAYRRLWSERDQRPTSFDGRPRLRVRAEATDKVINVAAAEEAVFWEWAIVQTLRHTGIRIEELLELTQLSIRQYQRPNGEVIALLVIAPSKTDRETRHPDVRRTLPRRRRRGSPAYAARTHRPTDNPLRRRGDAAQPTMPFLFHQLVDSVRSVFGYNTVTEMLARRCARLAERYPSFAEARFTAHDFRRIFATDLVSNGLPIHIGAALRGHINLETTRGYVAVFEEDLVRHYKAFLDRRRSLRPSEEYRPATDAEWREFQQHFDKRKVELGSFGRPYGTPCVHEQACVRCPMLHVSPTMIGRLDELESDLIARRSRAHREGWLDESESLDLTPSHLRGKREQTRRLARAAGLVELDGPDHERRTNEGRA